SRPLSRRRRLRFVSSEGCCPNAVVSGERPSVTDQLAHVANCRGVTTIVVRKRNGWPLASEKGAELVPRVACADVKYQQVFAQAFPKILTHVPAVPHEPCFERGFVGQRRGAGKVVYQMSDLGKHFEDREPLPHSPHRLHPGVDWSHGQDELRARVDAVEL